MRGGAAGELVTELRAAPLAARVRLAVKAVTPPLLWAALKEGRSRLRNSEQLPVPQRGAVSGDPPEWEYVPEGWAREDSDPKVRGWDVDEIVESYRRRWPSFVRALEGSGPLGIAHEVVGDTVATEDRAAHNTLVSFAYALALAAGGRERVSVLDWGGGIGHYLLVSRAVLPGIEIDYHCQDVPKLAALGRELFPEARFVSDESCFDRSYDLVLASGSLQYSRDWAAALAKLAGAARGYLSVTRLPVARVSPSFVVVQRPYAYGYGTEYLGWVVNRDELVAAAEAAGQGLVRELLVEASLSAEGAPESPVEHRGFLFRPRVA